MGQRDAAARRISEIDWQTWKAHDPATLVFVVRGGRILLIRKKRGLGAGKINGPGGRLEPGESPLDCAVREVQEELRTTPTGLEIMITLGVYGIGFFILSVLYKIVVSVRERLEGV